MEGKVSLPSPTKEREIAIADYLNPVSDPRPSPDREDTAQTYGHINPLGQKLAMRGTRFDSGVADLDQVGTEIPLQQGRAMRPLSMAKTYDYADYGSHQYEELPQTGMNNNRHKQMSPDSVDSHSSNGTTVTSGVHSEVEERGENSQTSEQRKRYNPMYDTMINSSPTIYNKVNEVAKSRASNRQRRQMCCLRLVIILLFIISCSSLTICVVLLLAKNQTGSDVENLQREIRELTRKYNSINKKMEQLESIVAGNKSFEYISDLDKKLDHFENFTYQNISELAEKISQVTVQVIDNIDQIETVFNNITSDIAIMESNMQGQMKSISKMEGPRGKQGVGNLSLCYFETYESNTHDSNPTTSTLWKPSDEDLKTKIVMFAHCTVENSEYHNLHFQKLTQNKVKYRCMCTGKSSAADNIRVCKLHLWICPRES